MSSLAFHRFLTWLAPDPAEAADRYNAIHRGLARTFVSRGCDRPEELADETLDRVVRQVHVVAAYAVEPAAYIHGVAKKVVIEHLRSRQRAETGGLELDRLPAPVHTGEDVARESVHACLDHCLAQLSADDRDLILRYYRDDKWAKIAGRQQLAGYAQLTSAALRKRTQRIRRRLKTSLEACGGACAGPKAPADA